MEKTRLQKLRKLTLIFSMLLFPITIWYFSPYLIIQAAMEHVINGSFIVFTLMFIFGMFFGRLWCGFLCPTGGMSECFCEFSDKSPKQGWRNFIKYGIWIIWISGIIICHIMGKGEYKINPFYMTDHGISISSIYNYVIYYGIVILFLIPAVIHGKRANCHYICWMAPFMILGYQFGKLIHIPQLKIKAKKSNCTGCGRCSKKCPMALDVKKISQNGFIKSSECINCGVCISECQNNVLKYSITNK
ncbi:MAG: 4Fe-4S dicluster domain-containing protein [Treponema sp.]|nr:4Fe-4S dicluster domain-containing protein [Treponema sp.]